MGQSFPPREMCLADPRLLLMEGNNVAQYENTQPTVVILIHWLGLCGETPNSDTHSEGYLGFGFFLLSASLPGNVLFFLFLLSFFVEETTMGGREMQNSDAALPALWFKKRLK